MESFIYTQNNVLSTELCQALLARFEASKNIEEGRTGGGVDKDKKYSFDVSISRNQEFSNEFQQVLQLTSQHVIEYFRKYYFALIGSLGMTLQDPVTKEPVKITQDNFHELAEPKLAQFIPHLFRLGDVTMQHYPKGKGGYPYWHSEVYPQLPHNEPLHRILLFMYYLNDVDEGGETDFYYQDLSIKPVAGKLVIAPAYFTHTHRGNIPKSNDKYILTSWVMFNRAEQLYRT